MSYQCPICHEPLILTHKSWGCCHRHSFDIAKEGYVNLMPVQHKHSKEPGDNQEMMQARRTFLDAGYYQPLREKLYSLITLYLDNDSSVLLDIGCGEGYYTAMLAEQLLRERANFSVYGLDISKGAIRSASKRYKKVNFCVASSYRLPFISHSIDVMLRVYAPSDHSEMKRVLTENGILVTVTPAPNHLQQIKSLIYDEVKHHNDDVELIDGFELQAQQRLSYKMQLTDQQAVNLLQMTPFAWRANESVMRELKKISIFECDADFYISIYKKINRL